MIKVSVVIPVYNMEKYLRQCLDSVVSQTLKDIEIICVNDGSTDSSLSILNEYAANDDRFIIISKPNSGYGHSMNCGFDRASGEYIGIVESDDYAEPEMFEELYLEAVQYDLDVIKSGFMYFWSTPEVKNVKEVVGSSILCSRVFCPTTGFKSDIEQVEFFNSKPAIWSAIYKRSFIISNSIRFHETPGASYQDASFNFQVMALAKRVKLSQKCYIHYRQDNELSSINSPGKVYCVCDEYDEIETFLNKHESLKERLEKIRLRIKFDTYMWNYDRLSEPLQKQFLQHISQEFKNDVQSMYFDKSLYPTYKWKEMAAIIQVPDEYHKYRVERSKGNRYRIKWPEKTSIFRQLFGYVQAVYLCIKEHGLEYTISRLKCKISRG